jgi:hypothetical protein
LALVELQVALLVVRVEHRRLYLVLSLLLPQLGVLDQHKETLPLLARSVLDQPQTDLRVSTQESRLQVELQTRLLDHR